MLKAATVKLSNGSTIDVDFSEWTLLGAANWNSLRDDGYWKWNVTVHRHADGRQLACVECRPPGSQPPEWRGELVAGDADPEHALHRLAGLYSLPVHMVPHCCEAVHGARERGL